MTCLSRATFVTAVEVLPDAVQRLATLARRDRDPARVMVLEEEGAPRLMAAGDATARASVEILDHRDERVHVRVRCDMPGYLRLADPFDPGWVASVDGIAAPVYAADHYLRAVHLEAGRHDVVFEFAAPRVVWPPRVSLLVLLLLLGTLVFARRR